MKKVLLVVIAVLVFLIMGMSAHILTRIHDQEKAAAHTASIDAAMVACEESADCFGEIFLKIVREDGLPEGFAFIKKAFETTPSFRPVCHGATRHFVTLLYNEHKDYTKLELTPDSTWCNYAFAMSYPEALLLDIKDPKEAVKVCEYIKMSLGESAPGSEAECYRGIGRGIPDVTLTEQGQREESAKVLTDICYEISSDLNNQQSCVNGVFNGLADFPLEEQGDPMVVCNDLTPNLKENCFSNYKTATYSLLDRSSVEGIIKSLDIINELFKERQGDPAKDIVFSYGYTFVGAHTVVDEDVETAVNTCLEFPTEVMKYCMWGMSVGIAKSGMPNTQYKLLTRFCAVAQSKAHVIANEDCPSSQALGYLHGIYPKDTFNEILSYMEKELHFKPVFTEEDTFGY